MRRDLRSFCSGPFVCQDGKVTSYGVSIDFNKLDRYLRKAASNKSKQCQIGPLVIEITNGPLPNELMLGKQRRKRR